ncbi:AlpA family transcriptional regulator [Microbulbifer sp. OS29]|uniref:AlpA family transcriptional regulator n=1 Tax=Microbulbifer okhotskensis TaxID=2926617 RepID=A0A9X2J7A6_9GAMM|nr:AlpA family transcriptional regulator [Microbulbifer okhotskensis]MCO1336374.1 AlpA family transcriptional regulator [Microbulbifer okhotskensis]
MNHQELMGRDMKTPRRILRLREVERVTGYKRSSIYRMVQEGLFPKQKRIGPGAVGWDSREIEAWIDEKLDGAA